MEIITYPSPILRKKSTKISNLTDPRIKDLAKELLKTMKEKDGLGLAAPQIGQPIRMIAVNTKAGDQIFLNPKITLKSFFKKEILEEGCLSLPDIFGLVKRTKKVKVKYYNLEGQKIKIWTEGLLARVLQHEIDHLKGILFIDRAKVITKGKDGLEKLNPNRHEK